MYKGKIAKSKAEKGAIKNELLQSKIDHRKELDQLKVEHRSKLRDLIKRHDKDVLARKQQVAELKSTL